MLHLPAELRSIVLSYLPMATLANLFKISTLVPCASREIYRRPKHMIVSQRSCYCTSRQQYSCDDFEITHYYGLHAFNANKGLIYFLCSNKYIDVSDLDITNVIFLRNIEENKKQMVFLLGLTSSQKLSLTRISFSEEMKHTVHIASPEGITFACGAWRGESVAFLSGTSVYLTDRIYDNPVIWDKLSCVIDITPREMQLWTVRNTQYLALLDTENTLHIYTITGRLPIHTVPNVASLLPRENAGGYVDMCGNSFVWKRSGTKQRSAKLHLIPYYNTYLMHSGHETCHCDYFSPLGNDKKGITISVIFDPVSDEIDPELS